MRRTRVLFAVGAAAALVVGAPTTASSDPRPLDMHQWSDEVAAPFSLAVDGQRVLVADGMTGVIGQLQPDGSIAPVIDGIPGVAGLATRGRWMAYGSSVEDGSTEPPKILESGLNIVAPDGTTVYADIHAYEVANNPDADFSYGVTNPDPCASELSSRGPIDSHVYAVTGWQGDWLVADAGANAVFRVTDEGDISTVAVLPPTAVTVTQELVDQYSLPSCLVGETFYAEAVPTGITVGQGGAVYVTTLPGFPGESQSTGAVWRVNPDSGAISQVASGLSGATSVAASGRTLYVAQLFGPGIAAVNGGAVSLFADLPGVLSVATAPNGTVWASTMDLSGQTPGTIVSISNKKVTVQGHIR